MNPRTLPVDVVQTQLHDVASPQPEAGEQKQNGSVALAYRRGQIARANQAFHIFRWQISWQGTQAPMGKHGDGSQQSGTTAAFGDEKP
jgi:hypothetical protein